MLVWATPIACGGQSRRATPGATAGAAQLAGAAGVTPTTGGSGSGESGGASTGGANSAQAGAGGSAGVIVISNGPKACSTSDGRPGILVDVFPFPGPVAQCEPLRQPGAPDASCPGDWLYRCGFDDCVDVEELAGCCRPDGRCGLLETGYFGAENALGCLDRQPWIDGARYLAQPATPASCVP